MFARIRKRNELRALARFAGWQLGYANHQVWRSGGSGLFGMTGTVSVWSGSSIQLTVIGVPDQKVVAQAASDWMAGNHGKAIHVGVAFDAYVTPRATGQKTAAVYTLVRSADFSTRLIVVQPYESAPGGVHFHLPVIDAPPEFGAVLADTELILRHVLRGRTIGVPKVPKSCYVA